MGWVLDSGGPNGVAFFLCARKTGHKGAPSLKKALHAFEEFGERMRRMYDSSKLAAVPHAMGKPACELLHFAYTIGQLGIIDLPIVRSEERRVGKECRSR